ncbi:MAG: permease-like cell division protein FtsX [Gammaproteobacteria bacterium]|nr:permease-like cell division protein FtsX [Gammaproteobacteria bacterium]MBU1555229.1 permease-like cell division protein FtsX [Gammaproteobacteria bacterium]MBU2070104.1 permease-like cell division protein FtsX [Gammaproteobacteria bacterium]MBU2183600.1 permease-like cell division protein FtsX [Gammaproteobacteria bacterium]MBU2205638.1 permease-like cell division protein FtsX [Gammaproteobacteria bacterium]
MSILFSGRAASGAATHKIGFVRHFVMFWVNHLRQALASLGELWRTPSASLLTIGVLGVSLTLPVTLHLLVKNMQQISDSFTQAAEISLFIKQDSSQTQIDSLKTILQADAAIARVTHISKQQALAEFAAVSGFGPALDYLTENPLPDVLLVLPKNTQAEAARALLNRLNKERIVEYGKLDIDWLTRLDAIVSLLQQAVAVIALLLLGAVVLIIGNTIRLSIMNKKDEIEVMKLVGATDAFIQRPFLYSGVWYGVFGGLLAYLIVETMLVWLQGAILSVTALYGSEFRLMSLSVAEFFALMLLAVLLGLAGSYLSVRRHISAIEPTGP